MATRVVTIAHTTGAEGDLVALRVARLLGFRYMDEQLLDVVAAKHGIDADLVADAEQRRTFFSRLIDELQSAPVSDRSKASGSTETGNLARRMELRAAIIEAIHETAALGDVVIVSHAAGIPLAARNDVLRVLVTASVGTRARRLAEEKSLAVDEAERLVKESDDGRADYIRRFYGIDRELSTHYDLVVNTDRITPRRAADFVVLAAGDESVDAS